MDEIAWWTSLVVMPFGAWLWSYAEKRCTILDVQTGRRSPASLVDDYGSNRGMYWPWTPLTALGMFLTMPGVVVLAFLALTVIGQ